jgi:hypothetical protein
MVFFIVFLDLLREALREALEALRGDLREALEALRGDLREALRGDFEAVLEPFLDNFLAIFINW